jgi:glycosyltransferase involved in cell wall biosynthesis
MTVKDQEDLIGDAIRSILVQTFQDWELIIVDDGSSDNSLEVARSFRDSRINTLSTAGIGRSRSLIEAIKNCSSKWVANIDADDVSHPQRFEVCLELLKIYPECSLITSAECLFFDKNLPKWDPVDCEKISYHLIDKSIFIKNPISHSTVLMSRDVVQSVGGYDKSRMSQIDYDLWLRLYLCGHKLVKLPYKLGGKRIHRKQSYENKNRILYLIRSLQLKKQALKKAHLSCYYYIMIYGVFIWGLLPQSTRMLIRRSVSAHCRYNSKINGI